MKPSKITRGSAGSGSFRDLAQRSLSAVLLACAAIALTIGGSIPFTLMCMAGAAVLGFEWSNLTRKQAPNHAMYVHCLTTMAACAATLAAGIFAGMLVIAAGAIIALLLPHETAKRQWTALGIVYLGLAPILLVALRNDANFGLRAIFFIFLMVWTADTAAYFIGRVAGGPKLAPRISPGKTWSGFSAGLVGPAFVAFAFAYWMGKGAIATLCLVGVALALASQLADLFESGIKRRFGAKDAGSLLPGHGGLFDRVDGLIGAAYAAGLIVSLRTGSIAPQSLLIW